MFKIRFKIQTCWKISITQQLKKKQNKKKNSIRQTKMPRLQDMDGNHLKWIWMWKQVLLHQVQAKNKPINDICNIKLGKKYLFKTVQSPSTQSEHINRYSFGFSGFSLWLLSLGVSIFCWLGLLWFGCCLFSNRFFLSFHCSFRLQSQPWGRSSLLEGNSCLHFAHVVGGKCTQI